MKSNAELRAEARQMLKGRWKESVLMNLVPVLITFAIIAIITIPAILFLSQNFQAINEPTAYNTGSDGSSGSSSGFISGLITTFLP